MSSKKKTTPEGVDTVESPHAHFLDSGSFSLWSRAEQYAIEHNCGEWVFYETDEFYDYMHNYVEFVKKYKIGIDLHANIDVLPFRGKRVPPGNYDSHSLSYKHLKWLESQGLKPVPVVHYTADLKWLVKYIEEGYPLIGLGGLVGSITDDACKDWIDRCFEIICDTKDNMPRVKVHGFGVTSHEFLLRYPWWSVDSTTWTKHGAYGHILVPRHRSGEFILSQLDQERLGRPVSIEECQPWLVTMSKESSKRNQASSLHYFSLKHNERGVIDQWLESIDIPVGTLDDSIPGAVNNHNYRRSANLFFFEKVRAHLPDYPWAWQSRRRRGFFELGPTVGKVKAKRKQRLPKDDKLIIFYSGSASLSSGPEADLKSDANLMLTFHDMHKKGEPDSRFSRILDARKKAKRS